MTAKTSHKSLFTLSALMLVLTSQTALAQETSWKQNYMACSGNSPFINQIISQNTEKSRPLLKIGGMQAWQITDENGQPTIALTTEEGLTIVGKIIGPQGEDISGALLATIPNEQLASNMPTASLIPLQKERSAGENNSDASAMAKISERLAALNTPVTSPQKHETTQNASVATTENTSQLRGLPPLTQQENEPLRGLPPLTQQENKPLRGLPPLTQQENQQIVFAKKTAPDVVPAPPSSAFSGAKNPAPSIAGNLALAPAAPTQPAPAPQLNLNEQPAATIDTNNQTQVAAAAPAPQAITQIATPTTEQQALIDKLYNEAETERMWFSAHTPKEGAPVVYMMADPDCPHCQWNIDELNSKIMAGDIDLRIIATPITGVGGFESALSIIHSENVAQTFMNHMTAKTRGTPAAAKMDTSKAEPAIIQSIVDNINWMRTNKIPGVPFYFYKENGVAKFAFAKLPDEALLTASTGN